MQIYFVIKAVICSYRSCRVTHPEPPILNSVRIKLTQERKQQLISMKQKCILSIYGINEMLHIAPNLKVPGTRPKI